MEESLVGALTTSWLGRLWGSLKTVLLGLLLVPLAGALLFWNEGRAVRRAQDLEAGRGAAVEADAATIDPAQEDRLVHLSGIATTTATLRDWEHALPAPGALRLRRVAEMYQWTEHSSTARPTNPSAGPLRRSRYWYTREWSSSPIDSSGFNQPDGHFNPPMTVRGLTVDAPQITVGARTLTPGLVAQIDGWLPFAVAPESVPTLADGRRVARAGEWLYLGDNPAAPEIGDTRVQWEYAPSGPVSVLAAQRGATFDRWYRPNGRSIEPMLVRGGVASTGMIGTLEADNVKLTWGLRFGGWLLMMIGFAMILEPFVVVADVLPLMGSLVGAGAAFVAFALASPLSLLTVSAAWMVYRPALGGALLVSGVVLAVVVGGRVAARGRANNALRAAQRNPAPAQPWGAPAGPPQPAWQPPQGWGPPRP